jgi:16S rRNA (guanine527-N7)-methyltransferase
VEQVETAFREAGIAELPVNAVAQFEAYLELLLRWNQRLNLTSLRRPEEIIRRHFLECAFAAQKLPEDIATLLDYGSGAGLPGVPIAICRPEIVVTLSEAQGKKAAFLREVVRVLKLNAEVYDGRVESLPEERRFDAVSMRAVEKMGGAIPVALRRVKRYLILLTTEPLLRAHVELTPELKWPEPIHVPESQQIIVAIGKRVPRGTAPKQPG